MQYFSDLYTIQEEIIFCRVLIAHGNCLIMQQCNEARNDISHGK